LSANDGAIFESVQGKVDVGRCGVFDLDFLNRTLDVAAHRVNDLIVEVVGITEACAPLLWWKRDEGGCGGETRRSGRLRHNSRLYARVPAFLGRQLHTKSQIIVNVTFTALRRSSIGL
jgi:hypothetical protein